LLILAFGVLGWSAVSANAFSAALATGPAYILSRRWVWKMAGRSHLLGEVVPFWGLTLLGLAASTGAVALAEDVATRITLDRAVQTTIVAAAALAAYGVVWAIRFVLLDRFVFATRSAASSEEAAAELVPTPWPVLEGTLELQPVRLAEALLPDREMSRK